MLAGRKATAPLVERETATLTAGGFTASSFELRLAILEKQNRRDEIRQMLATLLQRTTETGEIDQIRRVAGRLGFDDLAAQAMQRVVSVTTDPVEKIQARIDLARFYETHNNAAAATREFASLLQDNPNLLGVIRAAVDFYWREKQLQPAVATLEAAATRAQPPYRDQLRREAAEKAADSGQYVESRGLLDDLLASDPYNGDLLAEKASTYARANDSAGLVAFYAAELKAMQSAPLPAQDKIVRVAALRRGYILALIAVGQFTEALEQYQQVLNAYPEDTSLAAAVSRFAENHQLAAKLTAYYAKATADSPRDYRWPLVLAHVHAALRHYPEAIAAYEKASYVRPDRPDILVAKADLETRLLRFDDALKSDQKLYELTYHDTQYIVAQATIYARLGNKPEALRLLRAADIDPQPHEPSGYVAAMQQLSEWHMFDSVNELFREVRPLLSANSNYTEEALKLEAAALTSLHKPTDAIAVVAAIVPKRIETKTFSSIIGTTVRQYLTPEEKAAFARQLQMPGGLAPQFDRAELAHAGGFYELEAQTLFQAYSSFEGNDSRWMPLAQLQSSRLLFDELGRELEDLASLRRPIPEEHNRILEAAFKAYANAGNTAAQLRLAQYAGDRFPHLFLSAGGDLRARLVQLSNQHPTRANAVVQYLIANGPLNSALDAIRARGSNISNLWTNSYTALAGLYFLSPAPSTTQSFDSSLGPRTVGSELSSASSDSLRGTTWFYYAARYGDYLGYRHEPSAADFLPASVEANPAASNTYVELAGTYEDLKQPARAAGLYRYALQLSPERADVYDRLALLAISSNERAQAIAEWRHAFQILTDRVEKGPLPPDYWSTAENLLAHVNRFQAITELKPDADRMLHVYAKRNGAYNFEPFIDGIVAHAPDRRAALDWILEIVQLPKMEPLYGQLLSSNSIPERDKDPLYRAEIQRDRNALNAAVGAEPIEQLSAQLKERMIEYARYLDSQERWRDEWALLQQVQPASERPPDLVLRSAALTGDLDDLLQQYRAHSEDTPSGEQVLGAASSLDRLGDRDFALQLEEFEYLRELQIGSPPASAWFGLARVRFEQKRNDEGLALVRDNILSVGAPFENLPEAVRFLEEFGLTQYATRYAAEWKTAEPWNDDAQLAFARLKGDPALLDNIRRSPAAPYLIRISAARLMRDAGSAVSGSDELSLLTHKSISTAEASQPFYVEARLDAARQSSSPAEKIHLFQDAIALNPELREPRLDLAEAAFSIKRDSFGLAAFRSYDALPDNFSKVEQLAAETLVRRHNFAEALPLYDDLLKKVKEKTMHGQLQKARDTAQRQLDLEVANSARSPVVTDKVEQPTVVKPKLKSLPADWAGIGQTRAEEQ